MNVTRAYCINVSGGNFLRMAGVVHVFIRSGGAIGLYDVLYFHMLYYSNTNIYTVHTARGHYAHFRFRPAGSFADDLREHGQ